MAIINEHDKIGIVYNINVVCLNSDADGSYTDKVGLQCCSKAKI